LRMTILKKSSPSSGPRRHASRSSFLPALEGIGPQDRDSWKRLLTTDWRRTHANCSCALLATAHAFVTEDVFILLRACLLGTAAEDFVFTRPHGNHGARFPRALGESNSIGGLALACCSMICNVPGSATCTQRRSRNSSHEDQRPPDAGRL
jgi:hypothetical protein